jgi:hypothetical protein
MPAPITPGTLLNASFGVARTRHQALHETWVHLSLRIGPGIGGLMMTVQRLGDVDMLLRCMEDDFQADNSAPDPALQPMTYQLMLSEWWIGGLYEVVRLLKDRSIGPSGEDLLKLENDLRLLRVPMEKHEIAKDRLLKGKVLPMISVPPASTERDRYDYDPNHPARSHIMPRGLSARGSAMWQVIDLAPPMTEHWLERRTLSDQFIALWANDPRPSPGSEQTTGVDDTA